MRAWIALSLLVACAYDQPKDRCEGRCAIYAIDRPIATAGDVITLYGNFDRDMMFEFPGRPSRVALDEYGPHRVSVIVPDDATAGRGLSGLNGLGNSGYTENVSFRSTSFEHELQPFRNTYEQTSGGRHLGASATFARTGASVISVGERLYLIGGQGAAGLLDTLDLLVGNADGTISEPYGVTNKLTVGRANHASVVIGPSVYVIGGRTASGSTDTIEGASLDEKFDLGSFGPVEPKLLVPREGLAVAILGNYVYAIGGNSGGTEIADLERAPIYDDNLIGTFEPVGGEAKLQFPRSGHTVAVVGKYLYVIGGFANGTPVKQIERFEVGADSFIARPSMLVGDLKTPRGRHMSTVVGDSIYVIGGSTGTSAIAEVERATIGDTLAWQTVSTLHLQTERAGGVLAAWGNHVYAMGGVDVANAPLTTFERASIIGHAGLTAQIGLDAFAPIAITLPEPRNYPTTLVVGNTLYVLGGSLNSGPTQSVLRSTIQPDGTLSAFEPAGVDLNRKRMAHAGAVYDNKYCVYGGRSSLDYSTFASSVECAPIQADGTLGSFQTINAAGLDQPRGYFAVIVHERQLYMFGGIAPNPTWLDAISKLPLPPTTIATVQTALPEARSHAVPLVLPTTAFLMSGLTTAGAPLPDALQGNYAGPSLGGWAGVSSNPAAFEGTALVVAGDAVFAIGGNGGSGTQRAVIDASDGVSTFSSTSSNLTQARYGHAAVSIGDRVYLIGGTVGVGTLIDTIEMSRIH